jgi:hypothetical protein
MKERTLDFKVYLPQLESDPGKFRGGVRRYPLYKNENSPGLLLGGTIISNSIPKNLTAVSPSLDYLKKSKKAHEYSSMPPLAKESRNFRSPVKLLLNDPINNRMIGLIDHPAFKQPKFTKRSPKILYNNPITGYCENYSASPSPENRSKLSDYGSRMLS